MEKVDLLEKELQTYIDNFTQLAQMINMNQSGQPEILAHQLVESKNKMIEMVHQMPFLDKGADALAKEVKAWEELNKNSIERSLKVDRELEQVEQAIHKALESLHKKDA